MQRSFHPFPILALKLAALMALVTLLQRSLLRWALAVQIEILESHGVRAEALPASSAKFLVAIGVPIVVSTLGAAWILRAELRGRARPLTRALMRVAQGSLSTALPPDPDLEPVRLAFARMQVALQAARERIAQNDAQRRRLFADLAHELATPASFFLGMADTLARPDLVADRAARARLASAFETEALGLGRLVQDVRHLAELDDPDFSIETREVELDPLVEMVCDRLEFGGRRVIVRELEPCRAKVDANRIDQLLTNLLNNALRHAPSGEAVRVRLWGADATIHLVVEDSGPGVPTHLLPHLGERLFRVDSARDRRDGGHGLGLSIARAIVRRHGGRLDFANREHGGLRATVLLPARPPDGMMPTAGPRGDTPLPSRIDRQIL